MKPRPGRELYQASFGRQADGLAQKALCALGILVLPEQREAVAQHGPVGRPRASRIEQGERGCVALGRCQPGHGALGPCPGTQQPFNGAWVARLLEVVRDRIRVWLGRGRQDFAQATVQGAAAR